MGVRVIDVAARRGHLEQHAGIAGDHERTRRRRREHETAAARRMVERELLRDRATPRHAEHVGNVVAEMVEQIDGETGDAGGPVGRARRGRAAHARHIEDHDLRTVERVDERQRELDVGAEAVQQQQRRARRVAGTNPVAYAVAADARVRDAHGGASAGARRGHRALPSAT